MDTRNNAAKTYAVDEFVDAVLAALKYWLGIHTDAEKWVESWFENIELIQFMKDNGWQLRNAYFDVDITKACAKVLFDTTNFYQCPECGLVSESSYCDECEVECNAASRKDVLDYLLQVGFEPDERTVYTAMVKYAFPVYQQAVHPIIQDVIDDVRAAIARIEGADCNSNKLVAVLAALGIMHHSGNITDDHCERFGFDSADVDTVRTGGITALFDKDEVEEWLAI